MMMLLAAFQHVEVGQSKNNQDFEELMKSIFYNLNSKNWIELESLSRKYIKLKPNDAKGYELLGISLGNLNKIDDSVVSLEKANELNPRDPSICQNLAISYCKINNIIKLKNLIEKSEKIGQFLKTKIIDLDIVFNVITKDDGGVLSESRKINLNITKFGPYPSVLSGALRDASVFESGYVVFEVFISPEGYILKYNKLAGQKPLLADAEKYFSKISFPAISLGEVQVIQKCKLVFRYDCDSHEKNDPNLEKIYRMGVGFSAMEAERNAYRVTPPASGPSRPGISYKIIL